MFICFNTSLSTVFVEMVAEKKSASGLILSFVTYKLNSQHEYLMSQVLRQFMIWLVDVK